MAKKQEYYRIKSTSNKTTSFTPADLRTDEMGNHGIITIQGMLPKANPAMMKSEYTYINREEKEALFNDNSFLDMKKKNLYEVEPIAFKDMPDEDQQKYNRKLYNQLQTKKD